MAEEVQYADESYGYQDYGAGNGEQAVAEEQQMYYTEFYSTLQGQGIADKLAGRIDTLIQEGVLTAEELDDRALEALKEFNEDDGLQVIEQFAKSDLSHVQNKSAFLCGVMKTYRAKMKLKEQQGDAPRSGPDEEKVKELLERTGYTLDITTGQRKYGGPPPGWEGPPPGQGEKVGYSTCSNQFTVLKSPLNVFVCCDRRAGLGHGREKALPSHKVGLRSPAISHHSRIWNITLSGLQIWMHIKNYIRSFLVKYLGSKHWF